MIDAEETYGDLAQTMDAVIEQMHHLAVSPDSAKRLRGFQLKEVEEMVGKSRQTIMRAEEEGIISPDSAPAGSISKKLYSLEDINKLRQIHGGLPGRDPKMDECFTLLVSNFKGGVAKSTVTINLAVKLAFKGYRVLVVDSDPQASLTSLVCGMAPDMYADPSMTLEPYISGEQETLHYAIQKSHIEGLDFIPSCSQLTMVDVKNGLVVSEIQEEGPDAVREYYNSLRHGIEGIQDDYDMVLIDSPPTLGFLSTMGLLAADGHVIPVPAKSLDFSSTAEYLKMAEEVVSVFAPQKQINFVKVITTMYQQNATQNEILKIMRGIFGQDHMLHSVFNNRADIQNLASEFKSVPEAPNIKKFQGLRDNVDSITQEVESAIWLTWPSKAGQTPKE